MTDREILELLLQKMDTLENKVSEIDDNFSKLINELFTEEEYMSNDTVNRIKDILKNISNLKLLKSSGKSCLPAGPCVDNFNEVFNLNF